MTSDRKESTGRRMGSLTEAFLGYDETDPQAILYDARHLKRATAISQHAYEYGYDFAKVACTTRYARWLTRQEQWRARGMERWQDEPEDHFACPKCGAAREAACDEEGLAIACEERAALVPDAAPGDWQADDYDPAWEFCDRDDDGAIKVYVCEVDG